MIAVVVSMSSHQIVAFISDKNRPSPELAVRLESAFRDKEIVPSSSAWPNFFFVATDETNTDERSRVGA